MQKETRGVPLLLALLAVDHYPMCLCPTPPRMASRSRRSRSATAARRAGFLLRFSLIASFLNLPETFGDFPLLGIFRTTTSSFSTGLPHAATSSLILLGIPVNKTKSLDSPQQNRGDNGPFPRRTAPPLPESCDYFCGQGIRVCGDELAPLLFRLFLNLNVVEYGYGHR